MSASYAGGIVTPRPQDAALLVEAFRDDAPVGGAPFLPSLGDQAAPGWHRGEQERPEPEPTG